MRRTFDAERMNYLINHPSVRPFVGGDPEQPLDFTAAIAKEENVFLDGEHGGFACIWSAPRTYEIHTFVLPEGRGAWALAFAAWGKQFLRDMGATHLWTCVLPDAGNVRAFTLRMGFVPAGQRMVDFGQGPVSYDLFDWRC